MVRNLLLISVLTLSSNLFAQDSLLVKGTITQESEPVINKNNIRYIDFHKYDYLYSMIESPIMNLDEIKQTYLDGIFLDNSLSKNWFINASVGPSAFLGNPLGCEDLFGRLTPAFEFSVGKWFNPNVGARITYQGGQLKNYLIQKQKYHFFHTDLLWNITTQLLGDRQGNKWDLIPFVGSGIIYNEQSRQHPFAISYGLLNKFKLNDYLSLSLEFGGFTTFRNLDMVGDKNKLGDNMLHLTAGISFTFGGESWKRAVDARPYKNQNIQLKEYNQKLLHLNADYRNIHEQDMRAISEMKKIFEIEGLLDKYSDLFNRRHLHGTSTNYPINDYNGLNSLRARLSSLDNLSDKDKKIYNGSIVTNAHNNGHQFDKKDTVATANQYKDGTDVSRIDSEYLDMFLSGKKCIGSPIMFFFMLNTDKLTDSSQLANLDEISRICKKYNLRLKVIGSADSATGNVENNVALSRLRSEYIAGELVKRGLSMDRITKVCRGGVNDYQPIQVNRCTKVELYFNPVSANKSDADTLSYK